MNEVEGLIKAGADPLAIVQAAVVQRVRGTPRLAAADYFVIDNVDEISRAAHFQVWLGRLLKTELKYGAPHAGVPYELLEELYRLEFVEHARRGRLRLSPAGAVVGC